MIGNCHISQRPYLRGHMGKISIWDTASKVSKTVCVKNTLVWKYEYLLTAGALSSETWLISPFKKRTFIKISNTSVNIDISSIAKEGPLSPIFAYKQINNNANKCKIKHFIGRATQRMDKFHAWNYWQIKFFKINCTIWLKGYQNGKHIEPSEKCSRDIEDWI